MHMLTDQRIDASRLRGLLTASGLLDPGLSVDAAQLAGAFPDFTGADLFLEYDLGRHPIASGFGIGFPSGALDECIAFNHPFLETPEGQAVMSAFEADVFASDRAIYLDLFGDPDPDWIEYDIAEGHLDRAPFVFFRPPSRFRELQHAEQATAFCALAPDALGGGGFARLLDRLLARAPLLPYRVGRADRRGPNWRRVILTRLTRDQVEDCLADEDFDLRAALDASEAFYEHADTPGALYALSIDVVEGEVVALDVECAFLFRIADPGVSARAFDALAERLAAADIIAPAVAVWLSDNRFRIVSDPRTSGELIVQIHHLKHRIIGPGRPRTKAYLHAGIGAGS